MAYQLVNLTTCKPFNQQFRQRVDVIRIGEITHRVNARAHNAPLCSLLALSVARFSQFSKAPRVQSLDTKKAAALKSKTCSS